MSKNLTRKGLALGTAVAFAVTGLTSVAPAVAAAGDVVSIAPTTGTGYGAYNTDYFNIDTTIDTDVVTSSAYDKLAIAIESASGADVKVKLNDGLGAYVFAEVAGTANEDTCTVSLPVSYTDTTDVVTTATLTSVSNPADATNSCAEFSTADAIFTLDFSTTKTKAALDLTGVAGTSDLKLSVNASDTVAKADNVAVGVTSWIDTDEDESFESTDKYPSKTETVTFYDASNVTVTPRIERFVAADGAYLNAAAASAGFLAGSLSFAPALNLDQINLAANFTFAGAGTTAATGLDTFVAKNLVGNSDRSTAGKIYGIWATDATPTGIEVVVSTAYTVSVTRADAAAAANAADNTIPAAVTYTTAGYTVPKQATDGTAATPIAAADVLVDQLAESSQATTTVGLRAGVKTFKYTAKVTPKVAGTSVVSNVPVIAEVTATVLASGNTLTVNGSKLSDNQAVLVSGVTDADGKFSVSVESSAAKAGEAYTVKFHTLQNTGLYGSTSAYTATYAAGAASVMTQDSSILAGSTVNAKYTLKDQFGKVISANASGTAYTVRLQASNTANLKKYATFVNGEATVSFTNYLAKGQSDSLTAAIGTGVDAAYADATITGGGDTLTASLYNPEDAAAVTTAATLSAKEITYDAFITGAADATNVAPATGDKFLLTGTVVDTTGAGIPGAVVTVSASGLQFVKSASGTASGDYALDTITVTADAAGSYEVSAWAHKVSSTGIVITTTSGGKSATTKVVTTANGSTDATGDAITADDLVFTWDAPAKMVVDTTYVVTAKVADKWGNPVKGANIDFSADGAIEVNSNTAVSDKLTNDSGIVRVYVRSLDKTTGVGTFTATFDSVTISGVALDATLASSEKLEDVLSADLDVVTAIAPVATAAASGSTGKFYVSATNAAAKKVVVKVGGVFVKSFTPTTAAKKVVIVLGSKGNKAVTVFIGGKLVLTKTVTIK